MAKEELHSLGTDDLKKKKKVASFILGLVIGVLLVCVVVAVFTQKYFLIAVSSALLATGIPMFIGLKKIDAELSRREEEK